MIGGTSGIILLFGLKVGVLRLSGRHDGWHGIPVRNLVGHCGHCEGSAYLGNRVEVVLGRRTGFSARLEVDEDGGSKKVRLQDEINNDADFLIECRFRDWCFDLTAQKVVPINNATATNMRGFGGGRGGGGIGGGGGVG